MAHQVNFICDQCEQNFMIKPHMELPPYWVGIQLAFSNRYGIVPEKEKDVYHHFCCLKCLSEYALSNDLKHRLNTVDKQEDEMDGDDTEESGENDVK